MGILGLAVVAVVAAAQDGAGQADAAEPDAGPAVVDIPFLFGAPEVRAAASPSEVRLGQRFTLFITAAHPDNVVVNLPDPIRLGPDFEVRLPVLSESRRRSDGLRIREWQIDVLPWELGDLEIPPVEVTFTSGGQAAKVATGPVPIRVVAMVGNTDDAQLLRGSAPPAQLWRRGWTLAQLAIAALALLAMVATPVMAWMFRRRRAPALGVEVPRRLRRKLGSAAEDALAQLAALEVSGLLDEDRKAAYRAMAEIIRGFLGRRYGFATHDLTTSDLRRRLRGVGLPSAALLATSRWLDDCDLVKFADHHATSDEVRATLAGARELIMLISGVGQPGAEVAHA